MADAMQIKRMANFVAPHDPNWKTAFKIEAQSISSPLGKGAITLHRVGRNDGPQQHVELSTVDRSSRFLVVRR